MTHGNADGAAGERGDIVHSAGGVHCRASGGGASSLESVDHPNLARGGGRAMWYGRLRGGVAAGAGRRVDSESACRRQRLAHGFAAGALICRRRHAAKKSGSPPDPTLTSPNPAMCPPGPRPPSAPRSFGRSKRPSMFTAALVVSCGDVFEMVIRVESRGSPVRAMSNVLCRGT